MPYTLHGRPESVILTQGSGLEFYTLNPSLQDGTAVPTAWVEYMFSDTAASHCFQEALYGDRLLLCAGVNGIYRNKKYGSSTTLCSRENVRLWQDRYSGRISFMARLASRSAATGYLDFECNPLPAIPSPVLAII